MSTAVEEPLLSSPITTTTITSSSSAKDISANSAAATPTIFIRLTAALTLFAISAWANYEASKSADISIVNSATGSHAGRRFDLHFVSNGRAHRIIHRAGQSVEQALYPDERYPRKPINHMTLRLASNDLPSVTSVSPGTADGDYTIHLSPAVMSAADADAALASAVHRAVARLWLWDGQREAPEALLGAMADYLAMTAGFGRSSNDTCNASFESNGSCWSAEFLRYCEARRGGFLARLNRGMREPWSEFTVEEALGSPVRQTYAAYKQIMESINSTSNLAEVRQAM